MNKNTALILVCWYSWYALKAVNAKESDYSTSKEWNSFKAKFSKSYSSRTDEQFRFETFTRNKRSIDRHNERFRKGEETYAMGVNQFSDLLHDEFLNMMKINRNIFNVENMTEEKNGAIVYYETPSKSAPPSTIDWRKKGAVTPVVNQGNCGSCWAFAALGALEGQHFRKNGKLVPLSEQQLVDCSHKYKNFGCDGGLPERAFKYVMDKGITTNASYPYEAQKRKCRYKGKNPEVRVKYYVKLPKRNETALKIAVANIGPITVCVHGSLASFMNYQRGIYNDRSCSSQKIDHSVLLVGYGTENGQDYWLIKNSWGTFWGIKGYMKLARNKQNHCGVASRALYPKIQKEHRKALFSFYK